MSEISDFVNAVAGAVAANPVRDSVIVVVALAVSWGLRGLLHPALISGMWLLVIARLLVPWSVPVPLWEATAPALSASEFVTAGLSGGSPMDDVLPSGEVAAQRSVARRVFPRPVNWIGATWLAGFMAMLGLRLAVNIRFAWVLRRAKDLKLGARGRDLEKLRAAMGLRSLPRFVESDAVDAPCLFGVFRPVCVFPIGLLERVDSTAFQHIAAHELAHLKRRDVLVQWLGGFASCVHWFNPLVWGALSRQRADAEIAADAMALRYLGGGDHADYGETLLRIATRNRFSDQLALAAVAGGGSGVGARIRAITQARSHGRGSLALGAALAATIAIAGFCEPTSVSPKKQGGLGGGGEVITGAAAKWVETLAVPISLEFEVIALKDVLNFIQRSLDVDFVFDPSAQAALARRLPHINMKDTSLGATLEVVLKQFGLVCVPTGKGLWVGAPSTQPAPELGAFSKGVLAASLLPKVEVREKALEFLGRDLKCDFSDLYLEEIFSYFFDTYTLNFVLDPRVVSYDPKHPMGKESHAADWPGLKMDCHVEHFVFHGPLRNGIEQLLLPRGLDYSVEEGYIWISTPEILQMEARWYTPHTTTP